MPKFINFFYFLDLLADFADLWRSFDILALPISNGVVKFKVIWCKCLRKRSNFQLETPLLVGHNSYFLPVFRSIFSSF